VVFLYTFRNDKGQTYVERGVDQIRGGPYTVPQVAFFTSKPNEWPADVQRRSYLVDNICGSGADWACPGPRVPLNRGNARNQSGARIAAGTTSGRGVTIPGGKIPDAVPFAKEAHGPFAGPLIRIGR